jgi:hypothetical protein
MVSAMSGTILDYQSPRCYMLIDLVGEHSLKAVSELNELLNKRASAQAKLAQALSDVAQYRAELASLDQKFFHNHPDLAAELICW